MVRLGIESLLGMRDPLLSGERLGLITNPSGVDSALRPTIDLLHDHQAFDLRKLFGPEHGIRGRAQAGMEIEDTVDETTGRPVTSLYGGEKHLRPAMIDDLDAIVYDMQDVGCRYYTLVYTLAYALEGVADAGKRIVVLDRPNPIAPLGVAGNRIPDSHASFVGDYRLPIVHGMTVGELAVYFNEEFDIDADLRVVELEGWTRKTWYDATGLPWVPPSPNMPTLDTATLYPGTCLFEGTNLSEGRGTTKPFESIGAPWIDAESWADSLDGHGLSGVAFRPAYFTPTFSKHAHESAEGVQVHVLDRDELRPVRVGLTMLLSAFTTHADCDWVADGDDYPIDRFAGGTHLRKTVDEATASDDALTIADAILDRWDSDRESFLDVRARHLLY